MFTAIESLINQTLLLDPKSKQRLKSLAGKNVKIEVRNLAFKFPMQLSFEAQGLRLGPPKLAVFDAIIHGPLVAFLSLAFIKDPHKAALLGLNFEGNIDVAKDVQALFMDLDIDWEEPLSKITNDSFAHSMGEFFRTFKKQKHDLFTSFSQNITDYFQEESKVLVSPKEAEILYENIEELRDRVERLEARINLLEKKAKDTKSTPHDPDKNINADKKKKQDPIKKDKNKKDKDE